MKFLVDFKAIKKVPGALPVFQSLLAKFSPLPLLSFIFVVVVRCKLPKLVQIGHISYAIKKLCLFSVSFDYFDVSVNCSQKLRERKLGTFFFFFRSASAKTPSPSGRRQLASAPNQINHSPFFLFCTFLIQIPL